MPFVEVDIDKVIEEERLKEEWLSNCKPLHEPPNPSKVLTTKEKNKKKKLSKVQKKSRRINRG